jgi:hypothetical protein
MDSVMYTAGLIILIIVGLYFLFLAVDGLDLETRNDAGTVIGREHREAARGHRMEIINNRPLVVPHTTGPKYVLILDIGGQPAEATVFGSLFDAVQPGDRLQVTFQKRRLTGRVQILDVTR